MSRPIGPVQLSMLKSLVRHRSGAWFAGCGWYWDTYSGTKRIMQSLERRGLVQYSPRTEDQHYGGYRSERWAITNAGRKEAAK